MTTALVWPATPICPEHRYDHGHCHNNCVVCGCGHICDDACLEGLAMTVAEANAQWLARWPGRA